MPLLPSRKYVFSPQSYSHGTHPHSLENFQIVTEFVDDELGEGEILISALYLSTDPAHNRAGGLEGKPLICKGDIPGSQVGRVLVSTHPLYPPSTLVYSYSGWRELTRCKVGDNSFMQIYKLPDYFGELPGQSPVSYALGAIGMPGITAHAAVEKILEIKNGGTLVVSTATGAVGNLVLQIGKLKGCKTLVFTSTDQKLIWLKTLGAGFIFNYRKIDPDAVFKEFAPEGIDFYFDNLGGGFTQSVMKHMKPHGRIAVCDALSCYDDTIGTVPFDYLTIVDKRIRLEGFSVYEYDEKEWRDAMDTMAGWISGGKITVEETIVEGFEKMGQAFIDRYEGRVVGVQVVKV